MRPIFAFAFVLALTNTAIAEDGCEKFAWPVAQEREALIAPNQQVITSGASIERADQAFKLLLQKSDEARFIMPPERKPRAETWHGGLVLLPAPQQAGVYQITLSDEAWVDLIQDSHYARSVGSSGRSDCPGLRKSVRFEVTATPITLQISGVSGEAISVAVGPAR